MSINRIESSMWHCYTIRNMKNIRTISIAIASATVMLAHAEMPTAKEVVEKTLQQRQNVATMQMGGEQIATVRAGNTAVTAEAARANTSEAKSQIKDSLDHAVTTEKTDIVEQNEIALDVTAAKIAAIRESLPRDVLISTVQQYAKGQLGIVTSHDGNTVIALIRSLTTPKDRQRNLAILKRYADANQPEAVNFFGYMHDVGLFVQRDSRSAEIFYRAAATKYAPAMFNLGIGEFYGRFSNGHAGDARRALPYFEQARTMALDGSGRICGWASFANWRIGRRKASEQAAAGCPSPLAALGAASSVKDSTERTISLYGGFFATGADDAFPALYEFVKTKEQSQALEFFVLDKYRWEIEKHSPVLLAEEIARLRGNKGKPELRDTSAASSAKLRLAKFKQTRDANRMQFSTPVPFLPFRQADAEMFKQLIANQAK